VYEVIVVGLPGDEALDALRRGLVLDGDNRRPTAPASVKRGTTIGKGRQQTTKLTVTLNEGRNRQIRRMCAQIGHPVRQLTRVRMGPITLRELRPGHWRDLTPAEIEKLRRGAESPQRETQHDDREDREERPARTRRH
jgi:pseudouridine synthase